MLQNFCARNEQPVICWVLRLGASKRTTPHARPTVLQNGEKVTVGAAASTASACAGNNLQLINCDILSQDYVYTQEKDIRLLKIRLCLLDIFTTAEEQHDKHLFTALFSIWIRYFFHEEFVFNALVCNTSINKQIATPSWPLHNSKAAVLRLSITTRNF
jgi:hypothetical protein